MTISICTTNYNCARALDQHLESIYRSLRGMNFEYIVVDNRSRDASWEILSGWAREHPDMKVLSRRCTMGAGRQIAFRYSKGTHIMVVDTDVVYNELMRPFVDSYLAQFADLSVQAIFCGIFPRDQWVEVGGRRSLNTNEDVDLWLRLLRLGTMRWYPVSLGENLKEPEAWGEADYRSLRYPPRERVSRLLRREWDILKTRQVQSVDLNAVVAAHTVDMGLDTILGPWPQKRRRRTRIQHLIEFARELKQAL